MPIGRKSSVQDVGERRNNWQRLVRNWRADLQEANGKDEPNVLNAKDLSDIRAMLEGYLTEETIDGPCEKIHVNEILQPAFDTLQEFAKMVGQASYFGVARVIWIGLLSVVQGASEARIVPIMAINLMLDLSESFADIKAHSPTVYRFTSVQFLLQDLVDQYVGCCVHACTYLSRPHSDSVIKSVFSAGPHNQLASVKTKVARNLDRLTTTLEEVQAQYTREITDTIPSGIADMPLNDDLAPDHREVQFPVTTIERARNAAFVGRREMLDRLASSGVQEVKLDEGADRNARQDHRALRRKSHGSALASGSLTIFVLHGLGGMGKTQLTLEHYYEHRDKYDATFWVEAEHDITMAATFAKISDKLNLLHRKTTDDGGHEVQALAIEKARNWLQTTERSWLLIFDNVEGFVELNPYLPTECRGSGTVIVTTQEPSVPSWIGNVCVLPVRAFDAETAAGCIFGYLDRSEQNEDERETACRIAEHVGGMPLAMATIAGYIKRSQLALDEFLEHIRYSDRLFRQASGIADAKTYEKCLRTVFNKALGDLKDPERELMNILAFLDPDCVPEAVFDKAIELKLFEHIKTKHDLMDTYYQLRSRQLIRRDTTTSDYFISVHRVVQWNILLGLNEDKEKNKRWQCFKQAFDIVQAMLPAVNGMQTPTAEDWPHYVKHGRQILELRTHCLWPDPPVELPATFAEILTEMGTYLWFSGKFPEGKDVLHTAEDIVKKDESPYGRNLRTNIYAMLGIITSFEGISQRKKSMNYRQDAYRLAQQEWERNSKKSRTRDEEVKHWQMHSDLAYGYAQDEDFEQVEKYAEECLEQYQRWEKDEMKIPFEYSKYYQLISFCQMANRQPIEAVRSITRCLELANEAAGPKHPFTQLIKFCHANLLWHAQHKGAGKEALEINKAVLEFRKQLLGEFSQFTLESYSTCGKLCHDEGDLELADEYLRTCLERRKRACWTDEGVARALFRHSNVLRDLAKQPETSEEDAKTRLDRADVMSKDVARVIRRYREDYPMPPTKDEEENLDQMVTIWAGRFTGRLKQQDGGLDQDDH